jgi:acetyltransferase-like isoleucine patch superfamily enzyme
MTQRRNSVVQQAQRLFRRYLWGMDIHASAWIAASALIDRTWPRGIHIGADCVVGEEVVILTHDLTRGLYVDTIIGDRTVIGPRAIILPGVRVGTDCIIQPGALVNRDVPDGHVAQGNPAVATPR